ncbi:hypothetical protein EDWATA_03323 [Edwardsiella tarda ATCC 23685]|uniref:Uncharacterized protein n=1 Tax=Edwardsiella tarda ATCC 23685 TaxID=500638 RepID=D4F967_EDWTA|nr:hypothetical protein EDWATA_03323 [Edwardsiella tarda ATCC 23685]
MYLKYNLIIFPVVVNQSLPTRCDWRYGSDDFLCEHTWLGTKMQHDSGCRSHLVSPIAKRLRKNQGRVFLTS